MTGKDKRNRVAGYDRRWPLSLRVLAMVLALTMMLTSSGMQVLAEELKSDQAVTETVEQSETAEEKSAKDAKAAAETQTATEAPAATEAPVTETTAPETAAETQAATEAPATETTAPETAAPETASIETQAATEAPVAKTETKQQETPAAEETIVTEAPAATEDTTPAEETTAPETVTETTAPENKEEVPAAETESIATETAETTDETIVADTESQEETIADETELQEEELLEEEEAVQAELLDGTGERKDLTKYIKPESTMMVTIGSTTYTLAQIQAKGLKVPQGAGIVVQLKFEDIPGVTEGMVLYYQVPSEMATAINAKHDGVIMDGSTYAGTYTISETGLIELYPDAAYLAKFRQADGTTTLKNGMVTFSGSLSKSHGSTPGSEDEVIRFGPATFSVPFEYPNLNGKVELEKKSTFNPQTHMIEYTITVTAPTTNTMTAQNVVVTDVVTGGTQYIEAASGIKYRDAVVSTGTINQKTGVWTIGSMEIGQTETLTYKMKVSSAFFSANALKAITNTATVTFNTDGKATASCETPCNNTLAIEKSKGELVSENGASYLKYTVTVTAPTANTTDMPNVTVEDVFGKNSSAIEKYQNVSVTKGDYTTDDNAKKLNWTIGTMTPGETVTLTYQAVIKEEAWSGTTNNGTDDNTSVSLEIQNNAAVKSDGVQYDSVTQNTTTLKKTWIEKVANVQNNGDRITFTITANSDQNNAPLLSNILTFTDALTGSYKYDGSLTVNCYTSSASTTPVKTKEIPISEILDEALQNPGRWICQRRHMKIFRDSTTMC